MMAFLGRWLLVVAVVETVFGVLKSKGKGGLNLLFWGSLIIEFVCACVQSAALFLGEDGACVVEFENRGFRIWTPSIALVIDVTLLIVEAVAIARKLRASSWFLLNSWRSVIVSVVLFPLLVAPAIPLIITSFWPDINDCFVVNRGLLDPLTVVVIIFPVICPVVGLITLRFVRELNVTQRVAVYIVVILVMYVSYSGPVLALGLLIMRTPSGCDKHKIPLISNLIPAVVTCCAASVLDVDTNPQSKDPEVTGENTGVGPSDASAQTPEEFDMPRVLGSVNSH